MSSQCTSSPWTTISFKICFAATGSTPRMEAISLSSSSSIELSLSRVSVSFVELSANTFGALVTPSLVAGDVFLDNDWGF
ncbi:hypothetical protein OGAPHI_003495 [Ogataea philodendri]|uniref:Uncharacterized protein n=1 Tax=Ogataea philodendri TaxID=1378263 RepID=A0A9P8T5N0_9ASCO|nr:uncharacterized protein OGAPHI_003495 [Ogataea philodendri]KAH3666499.1 hypothetical protein OGAPHI_003495 [Ogataea philodendri]